MVKSRKTRTKKNSTNLSQVGQANQSAPTPAPAKKSQWTRVLTIGIAVVVLAVILGILARRFKSTLIVASVNSAPISRAELNDRLVKRFGTQMLEAIVGERLISQEAAKQNIQVTKEEINQKLTEIEKSLNSSMSLEESLKLQGLTMEEFRNQIRIQIEIDKMFAKDATLSATEVAEFMQKNAASLTATTEAEKRAEAERELKNQKVSQVFIDWFNKIKAAAKIERYL